MMKGYRFYIVAAGLILVILSMVTMTVNATESKKLQHENGYYEQIEDEYVQNLRHTLTEKGFRNAGITMTKVFLEDGSREYTVMLHHRRMVNLSVEEKSKLIDELSKYAFDDLECRINLKFL